MKKLQFQALLKRFSSIPGLSFLEKWRMEYEGTRTGFDQRMSDLDAYRNIAKDGVSEVAGAVSGKNDDEADEDGEFDENAEDYREDVYPGDVYSDDDLEY